MGEWKIVIADGFSPRFNKMRKRYPQETTAVMTNLDRYKKALDDGGIPQNVSAGYIHPEKKGVIAIDQSGSSGAQLRLYLVPQSQEIHLITIGDKRSQQEDIRTAHEYVKRQRRGK